PCAGWGARGGRRRGPARLVRPADRQGALLRRRRARHDPSDRRRHPRAVPRPCLPDRGDPRRCGRAGRPGRPHDRRVAGSPGRRRCRVTRRGCGMTLRRFASLGATLVVATLAALGSYAHMRAVALEYGQPELIADLLPVSVDGMMAVATVALGDGRRPRWSAWLAFWTGVAASVMANVLAAEPSVIARC